MRGLLIFTFVVGFVFSYTCNEYDSTSDEACGEGDCIGDDVCSCPDDFTGEWCQTPACYGIRATDVSRVCGGIGSCEVHDEADNTCDCGGESLDHECVEFRCNGKSPFHPEVCNSLGECTGDDLCVCYSYVNETAETFCGENTGTGSQFVVPLIVFFVVSVIVVIITIFVIDVFILLGKIKSNKPEAVKKGDEEMGEAVEYQEEDGAPETKKTEKKDFLPVDTIEKYVDDVPKELVDDFKKTKESEIPSHLKEAGYDKGNFKGVEEQLHAEKKKLEDSIKEDSKQESKEEGDKSEESTDVSDTTDSSATESMDEEDTEVNSGKPKFQFCFDSNCNHDPFEREIDWIVHTVQAHKDLEYVFTDDQKKMYEAWKVQNAEKK